MNMSRSRKVVVLVNIGTPKKPKRKHVRKYLREFLSDPRVIDIPALWRWMLVNLIIVPFRSINSTRLYKKLWTKDGSPLLIYGQNAAARLQEALGNAFKVKLAMRYQAPHLREVLNEVKDSHPETIIIFPLFPQYASATSGSILDYSMKTIRKWHVIPEVKFVPQFYDHPSFLEAFVQRINEYDISAYDHVIMSYHGLPLRQIDKAHQGFRCNGVECMYQITHEFKSCYKATCYDTSRKLAAKLNLSENDYSVTFQSRLSKNWLEPFTDVKIKELADKGHKKLLVISPAFVADCLETLIEIEDEYNVLFQDVGGEKLTLVKSLNDHPVWIKAMKNMIEEKS
jgi:ferrochelatase